MKTLYLMRHGKAVPAQPGLEDFNRPLLEKGIKRTHIIIDFLRERNCEIEAILTSPAQRTLETAKLIAKEFRVMENKMYIENSIYLNELELLEEILYADIYSENHLVVVGHNPTITYLANKFLQKKIESLPTSGLVAFEFDTDQWSSITTSSSTLKFLVYPKMFEKP